MSFDASEQSQIPETGNKPPIVAVSIDDVRGAVASARSGAAIQVGFVPTMGSFHEGHLSLMRSASSECDFVVVSVFVNPIQFGAGEDFDSYPRDFDQDIRLAADQGVDLVFAPRSAVMYPPGNETRIDVGSIDNALCGKNRPGHFQGVATVVAKFFNIIGPDLAYFGQKDAQQVAVIRKLALDLDFDVEIRVCPIVREKDGLAMSSRNSYLTTEDREQATALYRALTSAREAVARGETSAKKIKRLMKRTMGEHFKVEYEYARIVDPMTMAPVDIIEGKVLVAVAAQVGKTRLIDNMFLMPGEEECGE